MKKTSDTPVATLPFSGGSDDDVRQALKQNKIGLTVDEARRISTMLGRDPTLVEAVIWGIQGSEHCSYKSSRTFLKIFPTKGKHVILGPGEDSGIVAITDQPKGKRWGLVIAHESHNKPSQIVPFEGAATGVGGVVRDVVCMGARVVGCMDLLRLGDLQSEETRGIAKEVARGIAGYGNPLGIPNLGGDTVFDRSYNKQCLVNAIAFGIVREDEVIHSFVPEEAGRVGYDIILVGKPTDRSGFGGASFASATLEEEKKEQNTGAVQEPNPFLERHLLASTYALFDWLATSGNLTRVSCKDLGAGGAVCASVEQVAEPGFGADVDLDRIHVAIPDLPPEVIACAETQERLCFICHPDLTDHIVRHYNETWDLPSVAENARASIIGKVTEGGIYRATHRGRVVCEAKAVDLTAGLLYNRPTAPAMVERKEPDVHNLKFSIAEIFRAMLRHPNGASKSPFIRHYDKTVIGNTVIEAGEADAGVFTPLQDLQSYVHEGSHPGWDLSENEKHVGVAIAGDGNGRYGRIDPYWQGYNAAVEAMRNVAAVGAVPRALTDCLNYGNPEIPEQLWMLAEGVRGIADAAKEITFDGDPVAIISGNVSLYNGKTGVDAIDPTAIVACIGVLPDARTAVSMRIPKPGCSLMLIGERKDECGGSLYYEVLEQMMHAERDAMLGTNVPKPVAKDVQAQIRLVTDLIAQGHVLAAHDISDGGLLIALFEMLLPQRKIGGDVGAHIDLDALNNTLSAATLLFSQTGGFLLACAPEKEAVIRDLARKEGLDAVLCGSSTTDASISIHQAGKPILSESLADLLHIWETALSDALK